MNEGCYECQAKRFRCPNCGKVDVVIEKLVDIFHVGTCPYCNQGQDEPCPERTRSD